MLVSWGNGRGTFALNLTDWWGHYSVSAAAKDNSNTVSNQHVVSTSHLTNKLNCHPQTGGGGTSIIIIGSRWGGVVVLLVFAVGRWVCGVVGEMKRRGRWTAYIEAVEVCVDGAHEVTLCSAV